MKLIITSALLAIAVFSMAAPINNSNSVKHGRKSAAALAKVSTMQDQTAASKEDAKAKRKAERMDKYSTNNVTNNNNGGGRTTYH